MRLIDIFNGLVLAKGVCDEIEFFFSLINPFGEKERLSHAFRLGFFNGVKQIEEIQLDILPQQDAENIENNLQINYNDIINDLKTQLQERRNKAKQNLQDLKGLSVEEAILKGFIVEHNILKNINEIIDFNDPEKKEMVEFFRLMKSDLEFGIGVLLNSAYYLGEKLGTCTANLHNFLPQNLRKQNALTEIFLANERLESFKFIWGESKKIITKFFYMEFLKTYVDFAYSGLLVEQNFEHEGKEVIFSKIKELENKIKLVKKLIVRSDNEDLIKNINDSIAQKEDEISNLKEEFQRYQETPEMTGTNRKAFKKYLQKFNDEKLLLSMKLENLEKECEKLKAEKAIIDQAQDITQRSICSYLSLSKIFTGAEKTTITKDILKSALIEMKEGLDSQLLEKKIELLHDEKEEMIEVNQGNRKELKATLRSLEVLEKKLQSKNTWTKFFHQQLDDLSKAINAQTEAISKNKNKLSKKEDVPTFIKNKPFAVDFNKMIDYQEIGNSTKGFITHSPKYISALIDGVNQFLCSKSFSIGKHITQYVLNEKNQKFQKLR